MCTELVAGKGSSQSEQEEMKDNCLLLRLAGLKQRETLKISFKIGGNLSHGG